MDEWLEASYEWDAAKAARNEAKHGVHFKEIADFDWDEAVVFLDDRFDYGEERFIAIGPLGDRLHVVVFTMRGHRIRLISLRRANKREIRRFAGGGDE